MAYASEDTGFFLFGSMLLRPKQVAWASSCLLPRLAGDSGD